MRRRAPRLACLLVVLSVVALLLGRPDPAGADISYVYDELGRLVGVIDPAGDTAVYAYDAVGNLLFISRYPSTQVSVIQAPASVVAGSCGVTLFGTGFSAIASENVVTFNGLAATVVSATPTQLVVCVPAGATTGTITVTTPSGSFTTATAIAITAGTGGPTVTGFTPAIGDVSTVVVITGTHFEPTPSANDVRFNGTRATLTAASPTSLSVTVPLGTTSGRIAVATPAGRVESNADFFVPPAPYVAANVEVATRMAIGQTRTITITTPSKIALVLFDANPSLQASLEATNGTISGGSGIGVYDPSGTRLYGVGFSGPTYYFFNLNPLPRTGTYTIDVHATGAATGP